MHEKINPFDILSGKVAKNWRGTFYFKEAGINVREDGFPIWKNLHREDGPAIEYHDGRRYWYYNGVGYEEQDYKRILEIHQNDYTRNKPV